LEIVKEKTQNKYASPDSNSPIWKSAVNEWCKVL
jgi:hypothetical protein